MVLRTIKCKLAVASTDSIDATMKAFAEACNWVADYGRTNKVWRQFALHRLCYKEIRQRFGLSANLAVRVIARVSPRLMNQKTRNSTFHPTSVDYDLRIFSFKERDWLVSLTLLTGRHRFFLDIGNYQRQALRGKKPKCATLCRCGKNYFINIVIEEPDPVNMTPSSVIGVDMGITDLAVLSDGTKFSGTAMSSYRLRRSKIRRSVQSKASRKSRPTRRNCRRLSARLKGRETRYARAINHWISRQIVNKAVAHNAAIAIENLANIREGTNKHLRKAQRVMHNTWAFYQLRLFLEYKAKRKGIQIVLVDPAYTSQTCHVCGKRGQRTGKKFVCRKCNIEQDADENAACNIACLGAAHVTSPEQSRISVVSQHDVSG